MLTKSSRAKVVVVSFFLSMFMCINAHAQNAPAASSIPPTATADAVPAVYGISAGNYVRTWIPSIKTLDASAVVGTASVQDIKQATQYFDGLGRQLQTVNRGESPAGHDIVTAQVYDDFGREQYKYLPYIHPSANDGNFKTSPFADQKIFYQNTTMFPNLAGETVYYSQFKFESSPLSRTLNEYKAGNSWALTGGNHPVQTQYLSNALTDSVRIWNMSGGAIPTSTATYGAGALYKEVVIDEQGNTTATFKDKQEHVVLKKTLLSGTSSGHSGWLCTYYVYDDFDNLVFVISPKAVAAIASTWVITQNIADDLCFQYNFDERNRMITKKVAGAGVVEMVYDLRDRLVFTRDGNLAQGSTPQWLVTFYDNQNREVMTAFYPSGATRAQLQTSMNAVTAGSTTLTNTLPGATDLTVSNRVAGQASYIASQSISFLPGFEAETAAEFTTIIDATFGNTSQTVIVSNPLPGITGYQPLTYTFYDDYTYAGAKSFATADLSRLTNGGNANAELSANYSMKTNSLVTGKKVKVLGTDKWLTTTTYYDEKGKTIQVRGDNITGGENISSSMYDFNGKVLSQYQHNIDQSSSSSGEISVLTISRYDGVGRLSVLTRLVNDETIPDTVAVYTYDELGRLKSKVLGKNIETLAYDYNIRGWISSINRGHVTSSADAAHFGEILSYDVGFVTNYYNGNVAGVKWKGFSNPVARTYGYVYDKSGRLTGAEFNQINTGASTWTKDQVDFTVSNLTYDENGNIQTMNQMGLKSGTTPGAIDQLHYNYPVNSNKLNYVWDGISDPTSTLGDFKEPAANASANQSGTADYTYDANGNLLTDQNKSVSAISYNHLNLVQLVTINSKGSVQYMYDANGSKLRKIVTDNTGSTPKIITTDYIGGNIYINDTLKFISHSEGRIRPVSKTGQVTKYVYDYFVKDHMENVREVLTPLSDTAQYAATMEAANSVKENTLFSNIDNTKTALPVGYPTDNTTSPNDYVAKLNAVSGQKIGPSLVLRVMAGDKVQLGAKAFYKTTTANSSAATVPQMVTALLQAFAGGGVSDGVHVATGSTSPINTSLNSTIYTQLQQQDPTQNLSDKPKAYLNFVAFDDQFNLVTANSGVKQVQGNPNELQTLATTQMQITKTGFLYVYVNNESAQDVYFDNIVVSHISGPLLEETHYYPFGLTMAGISAEAVKGSTYPENDLKYNGKELQHDEFNDGSGLELYDYGARLQDPQLGRWHSQDKFSDVYNSLTPYQYAANNPVKIIDVGGNLLKDGDGNIIATANGKPFNRSETMVGADGKTYAYQVTYQSVTIYTDKNTPVTALLEVSSRFKNNDVEGGEMRPTIAGESPVGTSSNCYGFAFAGGKLVIEENSDDPDKNKLHTILRDDGYTVDGINGAKVSEDEATGFVEFRDNVGILYHAGIKNADGSWSADHGEGVATEHTSLAEASSKAIMNPGINTHFFKNKDKNKGQANGVVVIPTWLKIMLDKIDDDEKKNEKNPRQTRPRK